LSSASSKGNSSVLLLEVAPGLLDFDTTRTLGQPPGFV